MESHASCNAFISSTQRFLFVTFPKTSDLLSTFPATLLRKSTVWEFSFLSSLSLRRGRACLILTDWMSWGRTFLVPWQCRFRNPLKFSNPNVEHRKKSGISWLQEFYRTVERMACTSHFLYQVRWFLTAGHISCISTGELSCTFSIIPSRSTWKVPGLHQYRWTFLHFFYSTF